MSARASQGAFFSELIAARRAERAADERLREEEGSVSARGDLARRAGLPASRLGSVLVIAKEPVPGRVKTRLTPPFSPVQAAGLAAAAIADTLAAAGAVAADRHVLVLDGSPGQWVPRGWDVVAQSDGDLDRRLTAAFTGVAGSGPAVLVGMDTPQVRPDQVAAFAPDRFEACLGLAADGGYWAIGFRNPADAARVIPGVPMSRDDTGAQQLDRLRAAGLRVQLLDELTDVDTAVEAREVALAAPGTAFGGAWLLMNPLPVSRPNIPVTTHNLAAPAFASGAAS